jgi:hypothetical protein
MKNINEINPFDYLSFYFIGNVENVNLKFNTPEGMIDYDNYDVINTESGKIIAFKDRPAGHHNYICDGTSINIDYIYFDQMFNILDKKEFDGIKFFIFANSIKLPTFEEVSQIENYSTDEEGAVPFRCDYGKYGAFPFSGPGKPYTISKTFNVINLAGSSHIAYLETLQKENQNPSDSHMLVSARSYSGILKVIYDWAMVQEADVQEYVEISQKAKELWSSLEIPAEIENWLSTQYPASRLSKYLNGQPYKGADHELPEEMPVILSDFIKSKCHYRTLTSLANSHPSNVIIPQDILDFEKSKVENFMYSLITINNIDYQDKTYLDIIKIYFKNKNIMEYPSSSEFEGMIEKTICMQRTL